MTPAEHKTEAESRITAGAPRAGWDPTATADLSAMQAHAHLAQAAGTGTHYGLADALLTTFTQRRSIAASTLSELERTASLALAHAILADR